MPGLIREARDMQGIKDSARKSGGEAKPAAPEAGGGEPRPERAPRKKD